MLGLDDVLEKLKSNSNSGREAVARKFKSNVLPHELLKYALAEHKKQHDCNENCATRPSIEFILSILGPDKDVGPINWDMVVDIKKIEEYLISAKGWLIQYALELAIIKERDRITELLSGDKK